MLKRLFLTLASLGILAVGLGWFVSHLFVQTPHGLVLLEKRYLSTEFLVDIRPWRPADFARRSDVTAALVGQGYGDIVVAMNADHAAERVSRGLAGVKEKAAGMFSRMGQRVKEVCKR